MTDDADRADGRSEKLSSLISESTSRWRAFVRELEEEALRETQDRLEQAVHEAEQLYQSLVSRASSGDAEAGGEASRSPVGEPLLTQVRSLDKLVWRINADWMQMQRKTTVERVASLRDRLREALAQTEEVGRTVNTQPELLQQAEVLPLDTRAQSAAGSGETEYRDPNTGLFTEAGFVKLLQAELTRSQRYGRSVSVLLIEFPSTSGPEVTEVAETIRLTIRDSDFLGRTGTDELLLGLPDTTSADAGAAATRIAGRLASQDMWDEHARAAVATGPDGEVDAGDLVSEARARVRSDGGRLGLEP